MDKIGRIGRISKDWRDWKDWEGWLAFAGFAALEGLARELEGLGGMEELAGLARIGRLAVTSRIHWMSVYTGLNAQSGIGLDGNLCKNLFNKHHSAVLILCDQRLAAEPKARNIQDKHMIQTSQQ